MEINKLSLKSALLLGVVSTIALFSGCNAGFRDPFVSPPIGQKFVVPADPPSKFPMTLHSESVATRATLIKLTDSSEMGSSRSAHSSFGSKSPIGLKSIVLLGKHGFKDLYDQERIKKLNDSEECRGIANDTKELTLSYPGMTLVCGLDFTNELRAAISVTVIAEDDKERAFTSWGSHFSDGAGYRVVIQSFAL
jgi:hypothetical protein